MCDYSLMALPNRTAVSGEELVVHRFEFGSMGLASAPEVCDLDNARNTPIQGFWPKVVRFLNPPSDECSVICIPPGASLLVRDIPRKLQRKLHVDGPVQEAVFTELNRREFRDGLRFNNGAEVQLQRLEEGQRVRVLALSSEEVEVTEPQLAAV